jgi:hypothetical protein
LTASRHLLLLLLLGSSEAAGANWPSWMERAPLNTDTTFVDPSLAWWQWRAYLSLAILINLPVMAGLIYAFERNQAEYSYLVYVYFVMLVAAALSGLLCRYVGAFSIIPLFVLETFLLARFCLNSTKAAVFVALLYHIFQVLYVLVYRAIATRLA